MNEYLNRGNKLWESNRMFLPEHRQALLNRKLKQREVQSPILDQDQFEEINRIIVESIERDQSLIITYSDIYGPEKFGGWITKINRYENWLRIINDEDFLVIEFEKIIDAELV